MMSEDKITWEVFLPIVGIKFNEEAIAFADFLITSKSSSDLKDKYQIVVADSLWSTSVVSASISGKEVSEKELCNECPRRSTPHTFMISDPWGKPMEVTTMPRAKCICVDANHGSKSVRMDVIDISLRLLEDVISVLRLLIAIGSHDRLPAHCLISLQRLPHYSQIAAVSSAGDGYSESLVMGTRKYDLPIFQKDIEEWNKLYDFSRIISVVKLSHLGCAISEIDNVVISSLIQFGAMLEEANLRDCFLRGATAVEAITSRVAGKGEITKKFKEIGATLALVASHSELLSNPALALTNSLQEEWNEYKKQLQEIYKHRCDISHGSARFNDSNDEKLFKAQEFLTRVAQGALLVLKNAAGSKNGFYDCIDNIARKVQCSGVIT